MRRANAIVTTFLPVLFGLPGVARSGDRPWTRKVELPGISDRQMAAANGL